jgi:hypothetical protein
MASSLATIDNHGPGFQERSSLWWGSPNGGNYERNDLVGGVCGKFQPAAALRKAPKELCFLRFPAG